MLAMEWWNNLSSLGKTQICDTNTELIGSVRRHETLTGREIESVWRKEEKYIEEKIAPGEWYKILGRKNENTEKDMIDSKNRYIFVKEIQIKFYDQFSASTKDSYIHSFTVSKIVSKDNRILIFDNDPFFLSINDLILIKVSSKELLSIKLKITTSKFGL